MAENEGKTEAKTEVKTEPDTTVDHIILAIDSLERGIELVWRATGVMPIYGGAHPGRGTQNALLGLSDGCYLELVAPNPDDTSPAARQSAETRSRHFSAFHALTPAGWAVRVPDVEAERLRLLALGVPTGEVRPGERARPDGAVLRWRTLNPWGTESEALPFVIEWAEGGPHPSADAPSGCRLVSLAIRSPKPDTVRALLARAQYQVTIHPASHEHLEFTLDCS